ncbi:MAG: phosphopantothenoylcysteine decarboxylase [Leptonema sp. (in: bacteria)]
MKKTFNPKKFKIIITAGPTREWIDPVRFISNPASGKTGFELAKQSLFYFKEVVYITGAVYPEYKNVKEAKNLYVDSTQEMGETVFKELKDDCILIMSAAPADYTVKKVSEKKIKKSESTITIELIPTIDILKTIGTSLSKQYKKLILVGFAAETHDLEENAKEKLKKKNIHFICANHVYKNQSGFGNLENQIIIFDKWNGKNIIPLANKEELARKILEFIIEKITEVWDQI